MIGRWRRRAPVAANIALPIAGPTTVVAGSPSPTGTSVLSIKLISISGTSPIAQWRIGIEIGILHLAVFKSCPFVERHA